MIDQLVTGCPDSYTIHYFKLTLGHAVVVCVRSQQNSPFAQQQHCLAGSAVEWAHDINNLFLLRDSTAILKVLCVKRIMNLSPSACGVGYTMCCSTSFLSSRMQREHKSIRLLKRPLHYSTTEYA